jgi:PPOX class probable F420-dependent enzyme
MTAGDTEKDGSSLSLGYLPISETHMSNLVIPDKFLDLFTKKAFAHLATLMPNGEPQVTPVWIDYDGERLVFNTAAGRQKDKNLQRDGRVSLSIADPDNPYRYLEVRGHVSERTTEGADAHIDKLAKKYLDKDKYPFRQPGEVRVIFKVAPEHITSMG